MSFDEKLRGALGQAAPGALPPDVVGRLDALDGLLVRWGAKLDLSGFGSEEERIRRYFAEPLAALRYLPGEGRALDVGSGGGSPGLPFALSSPGVSWTLLEPRRKRRLFLGEAVRVLGLTNVEVREGRFEESSDVRGFEVVTTRGVRLSTSVQGTLAAGLDPGARFLWFSSEGRLSEGASFFRAQEGLEVQGPFRLLEGRSSCLLAVRRKGFT